MPVLEDMILLANSYRPNSNRVYSNKARGYDNLANKLQGIYDDTVKILQSYFQGPALAYAFPNAIYRNQAANDLLRNVMFYGDEKDTSVAHISGVLRHANILAPAGWILKVIKFMLVTTGKAANPANIIELYRSVTNKGGKNT